MLWLYVLLTTVGVVITVPTVLRAIDGRPADNVTGFVGFTGLIAGLTGLLISRFALSGTSTIVAAIALGLAAGAIHPEALNALRPEVANSDSVVPSSHESSG